MSRPLISVVTPSFNQGRTIGQTIESLIAQQYDEYEHFVMDAGSTDETVSVLERYPRVRWVSEPDRGQTHAINKGLVQANGEVFAYLNSDDLYRPGCFERVAEAFADPDCQVLVGDCDVIDAAGRAVGQYRARLDDPGDLARFWLWGEKVLIPQPAVFIRKSLLDQVGPFDERYDMAMDLEMWLRLARRADFTLMPATLAAFRVTPETKTSRRRADMIEESRRAALEHLEVVPAERRGALRQEIDREAAGHLLTLAEETGDRALARRAVQIHPGALASRRTLKALLLSRK